MAKKMSLAQMLEQAGFVKDRLSMCSDTPRFNEYILDDLKRKIAKGEIKAITIVGEGESRSKLGLLRVYYGVYYLPVIR